MEDQRHTLPPCYGGHLPNHDTVITAGLERVHATIQPTERTGDVGGPRLAAPVEIYVKLFATATREMAGQIALFVTEHVNGEGGAARECAQAGASIAQAPQYQGRI